MEETLKEAKDRHVHQLRVAYLVTRAERRTLAAERQDAPILEGIPIHPLEKEELVLLHRQHLHPRKCQKSSP